MINLDDELAQDYLTESCDHLNRTEADILDLIKQKGEVDEELVNRVFRAVHSVKGGAGFFDLVKIRELAHRMEDVLARIRSHEMAPTPECGRILLQACDKLRELVEHPSVSNQADIGENLDALAAICGAAGNPGGKPPGALRSLLVEDDFASRLVLQTFLSRYGECHIAVNGREAVEAFRVAWEQDRRYQLVCMDIMMPELNGMEAVGQMREWEETRGVFSSAGAKIIMTTAVDEIKSVSRCFRELCDAYLIKPVDLSKLLEQMKAYGLVP